MERFSKYLDTLSRLNNLGDGKPVRFLFHHGMLFSSQAKWWGDFGLRASIHEGIDITYYIDAQENFHNFDESIRVPAMESGIVLNICDDFLGQSIVIEPFRSTGKNDMRVIFVYAHINVMAHVFSNAIVMEHEVLASIGPNQKNPQLPPHLHFSCFEVPRKIRADALNWDFFTRTNQIRMIHPLFL